LTDYLRNRKAASLLLTDKPSKLLYKIYFDGKTGISNTLNIKGKNGVFLVPTGMILTPSSLV
jgi:hypothetical protein